MKSVEAANFSLMSLILMEKNSCQILKNILIKHRAKGIALYGNKYNREGHRLEIHRDAFRLSQDFTENLYIVHLDINMLNFSFLRGFNKLVIFEIFHSLNVRLVDFPPLPSLAVFSITYSTGLAEWESFPLLTNAPWIIDLKYNFLDDDWAARILKQIPIRAAHGSNNHPDYTYNTRIGALRNYSSLLLLTGNRFSRLSSSIYEEMFKQLKPLNSAVLLDKSKMTKS